MITLHILQLLENNGCGTIAWEGNETATDLLWHEILPVGKSGVFIVSRGTPLGRGQRITQSFDLYARGTDDLEGAHRLEDILDFFEAECYPVCDLPDVPGYSTREYTNAVIVPTSNIENTGQDETDRTIFVVSANVIYQKEN